MALPASGYMENDVRTETEMKDALEDQRDFIEAMLGGRDIELVEIVSGAITSTYAAVIVDVEGGAASDDILTTVNTTNYSAGAYITLTPAADARQIWVRTGGNIVINDGDDVGGGIFERPLTSTRDVMMLRLSGSTWYEVKTFRSTRAMSRSDLSLGTAALKNEGAGSTLDADTLDGVQGAGYLLVAAKAADSELLDGVDGSAFTRKDVASVQSHLGELRSTAGLVTSEDQASAAPALTLRAAAGNKRGMFRHDVSGSAELLIEHYDGSADPGVVLNALKFTTSGYPQVSDDGGANWRKIGVMGNGTLDADLLSGKEGTVGAGKLLVDHVFVHSYPTAGGSGTNFNGEFGQFTPDMPAAMVRNCLWATHVITAPGYVPGTGGLDWWVNDSGQLKAFATGSWSGSGTITFTVTLRYINLT